MITITSKEFEEHFDKYFEIGQKEEIKVTYRDKVVFTVVPTQVDLLNKWEKMFGTLPIEASLDNKIERE